MTDVSFTNHAWRTIVDAFAMVSRFYRPEAVQVSHRGSERFSIQRWRHNTIQCDTVVANSVMEALAFLHGGACPPDGLKTYHDYQSKPSAHPAGSLLHAASSVGRQWGSATHSTPPQNSATMVSATVAERGDPSGWRSLGMPLTGLACGLLHRLLLGKDINRDVNAATNPTATELLRRAAGVSLERMLGTIGMGSGGFSEQDGGVVFHLLDRLAATPYERRSASGRLIFRRAPIMGDPAESVPLRLSAKFARGVPLKDPRAARKVIEMTGSDRFALVSKGRDICGIAVGTESIPLSIEIRFTGPRSWSAHYGGMPGAALPTEREAYMLFNVEGGVPKTALPVLAREDFTNWVQRTFVGLSPDVEALWGVVDAVRGAAHGALVVFSATAENEAQRLGERAIRLAPDRHPPSVTAGLAAVDGALLVDLHGCCHAAGVILDGEATGDGTPELRETPARGSRFNSAVRYVLTRRKHGTATGAVVFSEDKLVDVLPGI